MMKPSNLEAPNCLTKNSSKIKWSFSNLEILETKVIISEEKELNPNYLVSLNKLETLNSDILECLTTQTPEVTK